MIHQLTLPTSKPKFCGPRGVRGGMRSHVTQKKISRNYKKPKSRLLNPHTLAAQLMGTALPLDMCIMPPEARAVHCLVQGAHEYWTCGYRLEPGGPPRRRGCAGRGVRAARRASPSSIKAHRHQFVIAWGAKDRTHTSPSPAPTKLTLLASSTERCVVLGSLALPARH